MKKLLCVVVMTGALSALADAMPVKKYLAYGWDTENLTPAEVLKGAKDFAALGMDGAGLCIRKALGDGRMLNSHTVFDGRTRWTRADVADQVPVLKEIARTEGLRFSMLEFLLNTKDRLSWGDDARWAVNANNMRVLAELAKECGIMGFCLDNEDYFQNKQYTWGPDDPPYDESCRLARQRGRELFGPVFAAYPEITIQFYFLFNELWGCHTTSDPRTVASAEKRLLPAFLDGIYDVMPPTARLVDGCEMTYTARPENDAFRDYAGINTAGTLPLVSPENRGKFLAQTSRAYATYLDAFTTTNTASGWYMPPMENGSRLQRLERNLVEANRWAYDFVWFWGEQNNYADYGRPHCTNYWIGARHGTGVRETWEAKLPGLGQTLRAVKDPYGFVGETLAAKKADGSFRNLVDRGKLNGGSQGNARFEIITNDVFCSAAHPHAMLVQGAAGTAGFDAVIWDVKPGQWYGVTIRASNCNLSGYANWRDADGKWTNKKGYVQHWDVRGPDKDGWYEGRILARIPEDAKSFVVMAWAKYQKPGEKTYFDDFSVFRIR